MKPGINDRWSGSFTPEQKGFYEYTVQGYVDHFGTWQYGLRKKFEAQQEVAVELLIGAEMMEDAAQGAGKEDKKYLQEAIELLRHAEEGTAANAVQWSLGDQMTDVMERCYASDTSTTYPTVFFAGSGAQASLISTWYEFFPRSAAREPGSTAPLKMPNDCCPASPRWAST